MKDAELLENTEIIERESGSTQYPPLFFSFLKKNVFMVGVAFNKVLTEKSNQLTYSNSILKNLTEFPDRQTSSDYFSIMVNYTIHI